MPGPNESLFRQTALDHYLQVEEGGGVPRVSPPWTWALFWGIAAALVVALVASVVGSVEVNGRGRGILRPASGVRMLTAQVGGTVAQVHARSGQLLPMGGAVLSLDSAQLKAQLLEAERQMHVLQSDFRGYSDRQDGLYRQQEAVLHTRLGMLDEQVQSQEQSLGVYDRKLKANLELEKSELVSRMTVDEARESLAQARRSLNSSRQGLVQGRQELASMQARRQEDLWRREQELRTAQNKLDALEFAVRQARIEAPAEGLVEAVMVKPGDVIQPGQTVGKLVPKGAVSQVVSFLMEKDRGFVKVGDEVALELDQYPYAEFGTLKARVLRISDDLAAPFEVREALGEEGKLEGPSYRVEIQLLEGSKARLPEATLRTGMLMNVRYTLRRQRPITLFFEPLRRWFR